MGVHQLSISEINVWGGASASVACLGRMGKESSQHDLECAHTLLFNCQAMQDGRE